ncbi:unnamed protein product, partial [Linum tenue]
FYYLLPLPHFPLYSLAIWHITKQLAGASHRRFLLPPSPAAPIEDNPTSGGHDSSSPSLSLLQELDLSFSLYGGFFLRRGIGHGSSLGSAGFHCSS